MNELSTNNGYEAGYIAPSDRLKVTNQSIALIEALRLAIAYPDMELQSEHINCLFDQLSENIADLYITVNYLGKQLEAIQKDTSKTTTQSVA